MRHRSQRAGGIAALLLIALMVLNPTGSDDTNPGPATTPTPTVAAPATVPVIGAEEAASTNPRPNIVPVPPAARDVYEQVAADPDSYDFAGDLRGPDSGPVARLEGPLATPHVPGCRTRILPANWSDRVEEPEAIGLHYTAGPNRAGWADMDGLTAYASSSAAGVSWHFLIDAEGHCYYSVPLGKKAWTIGALNSDTVNIEVIGTGTEPSYPAAGGGLRKLRRVTQYVAGVYGWPVRVGQVQDCEVTLTGIITHWQGGTCAGGHHDIKPYDLDRVVARLAAPVIVARDRRRCTRIAAYRARRRAGAGIAGREAFVARRASLRSRGLRCRAGQVERL